MLPRFCQLPRRLSLQVLLLLSADLAVVFALVGARHRQQSAQDLVLRDLSGALTHSIANPSGAITQVRIAPRSLITPGVELAHLWSLKRLEKLDLRGASISDAALADVAMIRQLRHLDLSETPITDVGMRHLASLNELKSLNLNHTSLTDEGLRQLSGLQSLRVLRAENTHITAAGLSQFNHLASDCVVLCDVRAARNSAADRADETSLANIPRPASAKTFHTNAQPEEDLTIGLPAEVAKRIRDLEAELAAEKLDAK